MSARAILAALILGSVLSFAIAGCSTLGPVTACLTHPRDCN
ncbi:hypothetical protein SAMN05519103_00365 [Rhizobiales bacterium GAS113]|nr:hypothetical protein SAMN05519103_00365 [Rhizobiales bacterium GAS113]